MTSSELNERFGLPGILAFDEHGSLTRARITLESCEAEVYLQGAQLTRWKPAGEQPVLFLSERSEFTPGKAIRGGIPICFPWFGPRSDGRPGPSHGFARIEEWEVSFAAYLPGTEGDSLSLTFSLGPSEHSKALGFDNFRAVCEMKLGSTLSVRLTVANLAEQPLHFEEALHSYFQVVDVRNAPITGLASAAYLDKRDAGREKTAPAEPLQLTEWSDRVFPENTARMVIEDRGNSRKIVIEKENSATTVVWNPWAEGAAGLADLGVETWPEFLCVEAANTASDAITLAPGAAHSMAIQVMVERA